MSVFNTLTSSTVNCHSSAKVVLLSLLSGVMINVMSFFCPQFLMYLKLLSHHLLLPTTTVLLVTL